MKNTALLVVDVQTALIESQPYNTRTLIENIQKLTAAAQQNKIEVIYVRHDGGKGDALEHSTDGWQIYHEIAPKKDELVFDKQFNSAFRNTIVNDYLQEKQIKTIILVGLQTEYCIDTTCKTAFEKGYSLIIPEDTTTTFDHAEFTGSQLAKFYESEIWNHRFAEVLPVDAVIEQMKQP